MSKGSADGTLKAKLEFNQSSARRDKSDGHPVHNIFGPGPFSVPFVSMPGPFVVETTGIIPDMLASCVDWSVVGTRKGTHRVRYRRKRNPSGCSCCGRGANTLTVATP